ncbi:UvrB/UvrC motif-containing protein [Salisediminibacterium beveridgei]|uniref:Uncharacterized protein yacH n=1 Tax=Salisediminibacterium beveridgei TaxID=632773 RepID=A0A1D7R002_9BACI|nr:UvrB/UvrC motif-containing protein [Salisediminibacterium beveridgei]AOM84594.1 Uncharacterized protein yacH [Salisediminibacterium beveridgei]
MLCQECEHHPATLHFTKIINGEKTEMHLCETCAKDKGDFMPGSNSFSIHQLLSGLMDQEGAFTPASENASAEQIQKPELECSTCGMTYRQFAKGGRFGCADCYDTFNDKLDPVLARIHAGNQTHHGKIPKRQGKDLHVYKEIEELRDSMQHLIDDEDFEEAARVRDRIRALQETIDHRPEKEEE